ncbi:unnamed protein product [Ectocarpus sp. CCAP 1310/34]|nr:unnamed protein product [Ectocarpus sp. CCAP 1310/34]
MKAAGGTASALLGAALATVALRCSCAGAAVSTSLPASGDLTASNVHPANAAGKAVAALAAAESTSVHVGASARTQKKERQQQQGQQATSDAITFQCTNGYPPATTSTKWDHIAEPHRSTTLTASSTVGDPDADVFQWSFGDGTVLEGRTVEYTFTSVGLHDVALRQIDVSTGNVYRMSSHVMVKYVRREIRQLKDEDREAFFDAMETLYRLPTSEGNAVYGDEYKGINFFVQMHLDGAGVKDCDHWHDDAGIMTHHVGYTLQFEQALQVVDPSVSIPYWEYTIESAQGLTEYGESTIFAADWFGEASPDNSLHTVDKGRWAYLPGATDYVHNPYGLLRSPWNVDGTPFVTRFNLTNGEDKTSMVSCETYQSCFDATTLATMNNCLNGGTHGPVHIKVGGEWNDPEEDMATKLGYTSAIPLLTKFLWRKGYLRTPESCTAEEDGVGDSSTCRAGCPAEVYENLGMTPYDVLMDIFSLHWIARLSGGIIVYDEAHDRFVVAGHEEDEAFQSVIWKTVLHSLCDPGHVGELYTSSAPYDPLFWVIHPTAERFLSWRRKLATERPDVWALDETWGYSHGHVVGETGVVCDWSGVGDDFLDMPSCVRGICGGHGVDDMLPFEIKVKGETVKMTNLEWYQFIYPDNDDLPYMYNEFAWDHCAANGDYIGTPEMN